MHFRTRKKLEINLLYKLNDNVSLLSYINHYCYLFHNYYKVIRKVILIIISGKDNEKRTR